MTNFGGVYRGVVVGNLDPTPLQRIRVSVPVLTGTDSMWAFPCYPTADKTYTLPSAGTGAWVMFEGGDLNYPVVVGFY